MEVYFFCVAFFFLAAAALLLADSLMGERVNFAVLVQALANVWAVVEAFGIAHDAPLRVDGDLWAAFLIVLAVDLLHAARFFVAAGDQDRQQPQGG